MSECVAEVVVLDVCEDVEVRLSVRFCEYGSESAWEIAHASGEKHPYVGARARTSDAYAMRFCSQSERATDEGACACGRVCACESVCRHGKENVVEEEECVCVQVSV